MSDKILIVDDEREIADLVALYLENENFTVYRYYTAKDAVDCIEKEELDLAILDVMLPGMSGFDICRKIREKHNYPVIMLTAKGEEIDKITGLTLGADDYMTKPFLPLELVARVKAQLRRYKRYNNGPKQEEDIISLSGLMLNIKTHECTLNEKPLSLTPTEFSILRILCQKKEKWSVQKNCSVKSGVKSILRKIIIQSQCISVICVRRWAILLRNRNT